MPLKNAAVGCTNLRISGGLLQVLQMVLFVCSKDVLYTVYAG